MDSQRVLFLETKNGSQYSLRMNFEVLLSRLMLKVRLGVLFVRLHRN